MRVLAALGAVILGVWCWARVSEVGAHWQDAGQEDKPAGVLWLVIATVLASLLSWYALVGGGRRS